VQIGLPGGDNKMGRTVLSKYTQIVDGISLPSLIEIFDADNKIIMSIKRESVTVNTNLSDDLFNPDIAAKEFQGNLQDMMKQFMNNK
jgi:hypothetical protein